MAESEKSNEKPYATDGGDNARKMPADFSISLAAKGGADNLLRKVKVVSGLPTDGSDEAAPLAIWNPRRPCTPSRSNCAASIRWISKAC